MCVCFDVASDAFHKSRKGKKEIRPQAINIGHLSIATVEKEGGFAAKSSPFYLFSFAAFMKRISKLDIQI